MTTGDSGHWVSLASSADRTAPSPWAPRGELTLRDLIHMVRRRAAIVAAIAAPVIAATVVAVLSQRSTYRAAAVIRLSDVRGGVAQGLDIPRDQPDRRRVDNPLLSQVELLRSKTIVGAVVDSLGMRLRALEREFPLALLTGVQVDPGVSSDTFRLEFANDEVIVRNGAREDRARYGQPYTTAGARFTVAARPPVDAATLVLAGREETIDAVLQRLKAAPRGQTDVVDVSYTDTDPAAAQRFVQTMLTVFKDADLRSAQAQSHRRRVFLEEQSREIDAQLAAAERTLAAFRSREEAYSSRDRLDAEQAALMALDMRRGELQADRAIYQSLLQQLDTSSRGRSDSDIRTLIGASDLGANPLLTQLSQQLGQYQASRDSMTTGEWRSAPTNPDVVRLNAMIVSTERRMEGAARSHITLLDARLKALATLRERSGAVLASIPRTESAEAPLVRQVETSRVLADKVREEYQKARLAEAIEVGQVEIVDRPALPYEPVGRMRALKLVLGALFGVGLGTGVALAVESSTERIRRRRELEEHLNVSVLSVIPRMTELPASSLRARLLDGWRRRDRHPPDVHPFHAPQDTSFTASTWRRASGGEAYRLLRASLTTAHSGGPAKVFVVTSALPREGKTTTSANLATAFALEGRRTLLVDCDLRRTRLHKVFRLPRDPGLAQVLLGHLTPASAIRDTFVAGLSFLAAGRLPAHPTDLFGSPRVHALIGAMASHFDAVILDTAPVLVAADAAILGRMADGILLVVHAGQTDRGAVEEALRQLRSVGGNVLGAVLNDYRGEARRYGEYYYGSSDMRQYAEQYAEAAD